MDPADYVCVPIGYFMMLSSWGTTSKGTIVSRRVHGHWMLAKTRWYVDTSRKEGGGNIGDVWFWWYLWVPTLRLQGEIPRSDLSWLYLAMVLLEVLFWSTRNFFSWVKTYDLAFTGWIMATTARLRIVFFLKTLLLESLNHDPSFTLTVGGLKTTLCVVDHYGRTDVFFRVFFLLAVYILAV